MVMKMRKKKTSKKEVIEDKKENEIKQEEVKEIEESEEIYGIVEGDEYEEK